MATDKQNTLASLYKASLKNQSAKQSQVEKNRAYMQKQIASGTAMPKAETQAKNPPPKNFLEGVLNFLEGPMQGMYKATGLSNLTDPEYAKRVAKDPVGTLLQSAGETLIPGRMLYETGRSWFDPNFEKTYGSEIIEGAADAINYGQGKDTYNETDTVNPWVKGIGGFALDVASDPLTYVPGALIAKPFTKGAQVARTALGLPAKGVSATTGRTLAQAAQDAAGIVPETATAVRDTALAAEKAATKVPVVNQATQDIAEAADELKPQIDKAVEAGASNNEVVQAVSKGADDARITAKDAVIGAPEVPLVTDDLVKKMAKGSKFLDEFTKKVDEAKTTADKVAEGAKLVDLGKSSTLYGKKLVGNLKPEEWVIASGVRFSPEGQMVNRSNTAIKTIKPEVLAEAIADKKKFAAYPRELQQAVISAYNTFKKAYGEAYKKGMVLTADGQQIPIAKIGVGKAAKPEKITALSMWKKALDKSERHSNLAREVLGRDIASKLAASRSPRAFDATIAELSKFFKNVDLSTIRSLQDVSPVGRAYLQSMGITEEALQAEYIRKMAIANDVDTKTVESLIATDGEDFRKFLKDYNIDFEKIVNQANEAYAFVTDTGAKKTKSTLREGYAMREYQLNQYVTHYLKLAIIEKLAPEGSLFRMTDKSPLPEIAYSRARANEMYNLVHRDMRRVEQYMDEHAFPTFFFYEDHLVPIKLTEAESAVAEAFYKLYPNEKYLSGTSLFYNANTAIPPTNFAEAVAYLDTIPKDAAGRIRELDVNEMSELRRIIENTETKGSNGKKIPNPLNDDYSGKRVVAHKPNSKNGKAPEVDETKYVVEENRKGKKLLGWYVLAKPETLSDYAIDALLASRQTLDSIIQPMKAKYTARLSVDTSVLVESELDEIRRLFEGGENAELLRKLDSVPEDVAAKAKATAALPEAAGAAKTLVEESIPKAKMQQSNAVPAAEKAKKADRKAKLASPEEQVKQNERPFKEAEQTNVKDDLDEAIPDEGLNKVDEEIPFTDSSTLLENLDYANQRSMFRKVWDSFNRMFNAKHGFEDVWHLQHGAAGVAGNALFRYEQMIKTFSRKHSAKLSTGVSAYDEAIRYIQKGAEAPAGMNAADAQLLNAAIKDGKELWDITIGVDNGILGNEYFRSGAGVEVFNDLLQQYLPPELREKIQFDLDAAKEANMLSDDTILDALARQTNDWDLGDHPLDTLRRIEAAKIKALTNANFSDHLQAYAVKQGVYSKTPVPGWTRITFSKKTQLSMGFDPDGAVVRGLDPEGYYPVEFIEMAARADKMLQESRTLTGQFGEFVNKTLDPLLGSWKFGMTVARPGHHIRNFIGNMSTSYLAQGIRNMNRSTVDATRMMAYRGANKYDITDYRAMLNNMDPLSTSVKDNDVFMSIKLKGGKKTSITLKQGRDATEKRQLYPTFAASEDLLNEGTGFLAKAGRIVSLQNPVTEKVMGEWASQGLDHWGRNQHMWQFVRNNASKYSNVEDLFDAAAKEVLQFHPESSILTGWETKYMRRVFPFYTWFRGAIPSVIGASIKHPARYMAVPKASFNLAVAMGVDPESLSDPFPTDQLFPSYIREDMLGPQFMPGFGYLRLNPGFANVDITNMFSGGIGEGLIDAVNPMYKLPLELNSMTRLGSGAPINDLSDYIDAQIPTIAPLSNITGVSPTGTLASLFSGQPGLDPQYQVTRGNRGPDEQTLSFMNWLTGMGLQNLSQPNLINSAEFEKRDAALQAKKDQLAQQGGQ